MSNSKNKGIKIIHTSSLEEAQRLTKEGWEPIECSIGGQSVVGRLKMDHHGELSHLEGVAVRAYRDHFGACAGSAVQGFVVTGDADADATFAIAALAGELPHPSREAEFAEAPGWLKGAMTTDLQILADIVNKMDTDPIEWRTILPSSYVGQMLLTWQALSSGTEDRTAFHAGVDRWRLLTGPKAPKSFIEASGLEEEQRIKRARELDRVEHLGAVTVLLSRVWGFDVWYFDLTPVVLAMNPANNSITVGVRSVEMAEKMFGPGGLKNVFPELDKIAAGWGGREAIGGSPRGVEMTWDQAMEAGKIVASKVRL